MCCFRLRAEEEQRRQQEARERQERAARQAEEERARREEERRNREDEERRQKEQRWKDMQDQLDREVRLQKCCFEYFHPVNVASCRCNEIISVISGIISSTKQNLNYQLK